MQKKHLLIVSFILLSGIAYLFYHLCKRDTPVITPAVQLSIPDSSWLYGTINLEQIRKDIAWSSLLNGDISKLFQTDTNSNTLLQIVRSPSDYSITPLNNIQYFSIWQNKILFNGLLFTLENNKQLMETFKSDSLVIQKTTAYSFRTKEGYWLYNNQYLLFIARQEKDSLLAQNIFSQPSGTASVEAADSLYLSCTINTQFYRDSIPHPFIDTALIQIAVKANTDDIDIHWNYSGNAVNYFNQLTITEPAEDAGLYAACSPTSAGLKKLLDLCMAKDTTDNKLPIDLQPFITVLQNNRLSFEFNGWQKLLQSFYRYEMNEEFETVMVRKDSFYSAPAFRVELANATSTDIADFITYLHQKGLISKNKKTPYKATLGNFDSELKVSKDSSLIFQNTQFYPLKRSDKTRQCILLLSCKPENIDGLFEQEEFKPFKKYASVTELNVSGYKKGNTLSGYIKVSFNEDKHPLLSVIDILKK